MMEIKFRYWRKYENKMYDKAYVEEHRKFAFMSELLEAAQERYIFQQFTGLKDRNGKDIYDGDLITGGGLLVPFELYWNTLSAEWWVKRGDDEGWKIDLLYTKMYEVVGNKFEDKHLLEGGNDND